MTARKESDFEKECVMLARRNGWDAWKNEGNGNKGIPDHSFLKGSRFVMVEFKREDGSGRVSQEQRRWQERHPLNVFFCDNMDDFIRILHIL